MGLILCCFQLTFFLRNNRSTTEKFRKSYFRRLGINDCAENYQHRACPTTIFVSYAQNGTQSDEAHVVLVCTTVIIFAPLLTSPSNSGVALASFVLVTLPARRRNSQLIYPLPDTNEDVETMCVFCPWLYAIFVNETQRKAFLYRIMKKVRLLKSGRLRHIQAIT